jgi:type I restriction enzyme S subunit
MSDRYVSTVGEISRSVSDTHKRTRDALIFLNTSDIERGQILHHRYSSVKSMPGQAKKSVVRGDILFSEIRPANGRWALVNEAAEDLIVSTKLMVIRADTSRVLPEYLYLFLTSQETTSWLQALAESRSGTFPQITFDQVSSLEVRLPSIAQQDQVAATVGALDDKIESNRQAIEILQRLSQSTYLQWRARQVDGSARTFGEFADVFGGATPKTGVPAYWNGGIAWATPTDITALKAPYLNKTARTISAEGLASTSAALHPVGTILMTSRATIGEFAVNQIASATNQGFIAVRPRKSEHRWFLFEEMRSRVPEMLDRANGSTFMELSRGNFKVMSLLVPNDRAILELDAALAHLHARAAHLDRECQHLTNLREVVLPELLSGRLQVPEAEAAFEEVLS